MFRSFAVLFFLFISFCSADMQAEANFILRSAENALRIKYSPGVFSIRHIGFHVSLSDNADNNLSAAAGAYGSVLTDKVSSAIRANLAGTGRDNPYLVDVLLQWDLTAAKNVLASRSAVPELLMIYRTYNLNNDGDLRMLNLSNNSGRQMLENLLRSGREPEDKIQRSVLLERLSDFPEKSDLLNALLSNDVQSLIKALDNNRQALFDYRLSELNRLIKQTKDSEAAGFFSDALNYARQARDQALPDLRAMGSLFVPFVTGRKRFHANMTIGDLRDFVRDLDAKVSEESQKKWQQDLAERYLVLASEALGNEKYLDMYSHIDKIRTDYPLSDLAIQMVDGNFRLDGKSLSELKALVPGGLSEQERESGQGRERQAVQERRQEPVRPPVTDTDDSFMPADDGPPAWLVGVPAPERPEPVFAESRSGLFDGVSNLVNRASIIIRAEGSLSEALDLAKKAEEELKSIVENNKSHLQVHNLLYKDETLIAGKSYPQFLDWVVEVKHSKEATELHTQAYRDYFLAGNIKEFLKQLEKICHDFPRSPISREIRSASYSIKGRSLLDLSGGSFNFDGIDFVYIKPGDFMMGSNDGDSDEKPVQKVKISNGFWMGKYELTQGQWKAIMGNNPS
jgi:hypothetical protein